MTKLKKLDNSTTKDVEKSELLYIVNIANGTTTLGNHMTFFHKELSFSREMHMYIFVFCIYIYFAKLICVHTQRSIYTCKNTIYA